MSTVASTKPARIHSIDMLKGMCMIFMLIDHWRYNLSRMGQSVLGAINPLPVDAGSLEYIDTLSFWLRTTTSFGVTSFLFLAGSGCYLWQTRRGKEASLFKYLFSRGIMIALLNCLLYFSSPFSEGGSITLHVLWPTGVGMVLLAFLHKAPKIMLLIIAFILLFGQNFFETISFTSPFLNTLWTFGFIEDSIPLPWGASLYNLWPIMPWFGILLLGYLFGPLFILRERSAPLWTKLGIVFTILFVFFRFTGVYGDANIWHIQNTLLETIGNIFTLTKYPPSLQFSLYGLALTCFILAVLEKYQFTNRMLIIFGTTPLFYYVVHLTIIRVVEFLILRLPSPILDTIDTVLFSNIGLILGTIILALLLWFLCEQYKVFMKKRKTQKATSISSAN